MEEKNRIKKKAEKEEKNRIKKKAEKEGKAASTYVTDAAMAGLERNNSKIKNPLFKW